MNLLTAGIPGTANLKTVGTKDPFTMCEKHKDIRGMMNLLVDDELVPVCQRCFYDEIGNDGLAEAVDIEDDEVAYAEVITH